MNAMASEERKSINNANLAPPRWMTRVEKADFRRVVDARNAVVNPVLATEFDLLCDYVAARSRIAVLRRLLKGALAKCGDYPPSARHAAGLIRQVDATTGLTRRLARDLHLTNLQPRIPNND